MVLNQSSASYDYFLIATKYEKFNSKYFHGFLENVDGINRYINGRSLQYSNRVNFIFSFSEIIIYSGINRPVDFAYINPIASHLEIEFNERQNQKGTVSGNAIWLSSLDWLIKSKLRLSVNFLIDEYVIDQSQRDEGKKDGLASSIRFSCPINKNDHSIIFYAQFIDVGYNTFRHQYGYNNFVQRGLPLGWYLGSAGREYKFGFNYYNSKDLFINISSGKRQFSNNSITETPYLPYYDYTLNNNSLVFKNKSICILGNVNYYITPNISILFDISYLIGDNKDELIANIGIDAYIPIERKK